MKIRIVAGKIIIAGNQRLSLAQTLSKIQKNAKAVANTNSIYKFSMAF